MLFQSKPSIITLTTDFGRQDGYVGSLHGVIHSINLKIEVVDISHDIPSYNIGHGAFVIGTMFSTFPHGTIHVGVVDPGVGSRRLPLLVKTTNYYFIGPDNGLFSMIPLTEDVKEIYQLTNRDYFSKEVSMTFHGRDIFAPVAAHLSLGVAPAQFGHRIKEFVILDDFNLHKGKGFIKGRIIFIDKFGNVVTNITRQTFERMVGRKRFNLIVKDKKFSHLDKTYSNVPKGSPILLFGSSGFLEIAANQSSLASRWKLGVGESLTIKIG